MSEVNVPVVAKPKIKFRLNAGHHAFNAGTDITPKLLKFRQGDTFETEVELDKMFNSPGSIKFERLGMEDTEESLEQALLDLQARKAKLKAAKVAAAGGTRVQESARSTFPGEDDVNKMTFVQLQELAEANNINLGKAKTKDEALKIVKEHLISA